MIKAALEAAPHHPQLAMAVSFGGNPIINLEVGWPIRGLSLQQSLRFCPCQALMSANMGKFLRGGIFNELKPIPKAELLPDKLFDGDH